MKKTLIIAVVVILVISMVPLQAFAATPKTTGILPGLTFNGTTATCSLMVSAEAGDEISAVITLKRGSTNVKTWTASGVRTLSFADTVSVSRNTTYTLTADVSINGIAQPQGTVTRTNN